MMALNFSVNQIPEVCLHLDVDPIRLIHNMHIEQPSPTEIKIKGRSSTSSFGEFRLSSTALPMDRPSMWIVDIKQLIPDSKTQIQIGIVSKKSWQKFLSTEPEPIVYQGNFLIQYWNLEEENQENRFTPVAPLWRPLGVKTNDSLVFQYCPETNSLTVRNAAAFDAKHALHKHTLPKQPLHVAISVNGDCHLKLRPVTPSEFRSFALNQSSHQRIFYDGSDMKLTSSGYFLQ
jgi:hypothetical protein